MKNRGELGQGVAVTLQTGWSKAEGVKNAKSLVVHGGNFGNDRNM